MEYYTPPETLSNTVFDPTSPTFGPIMSALQWGEFEKAHDLIGNLRFADDDDLFVRVAHAWSHLRKQDKSNIVTIVEGEAAGNDPEFVSWLHS